MNSKRTPKKPQRRVTIKGRGDYAIETKSITDPIKRLESKIDHLETSLVGGKPTANKMASQVGRTLGRFVGLPDVGEFAGSTLAKMFGHGDYSIKTNSLMSSNSTSSSFVGAKFQSDKRGTRIIEREYIGDLFAGKTLDSNATTFNITNYNLNPTDTKTFPWLSQLAYLYDQWEPNGIVFEFVSTSSEYNGSSQALGTVIMATDYDPYDPVYSDKQAMENSDYACSTKPAKPLIHGIECDPRERPTQLLYTSVSNGAPLTSSSLGRFGIATQGCSVAGVNLGELWISYDITFYKKQLDRAEAVLPFYNAFGTQIYNTGLFYNPVIRDSREITVDNTPLGSYINFNNTAIGLLYLITYYGFNSEGSYNSLTSYNCTMQRNWNDAAGGVAGFSFIIRTTGPNANLQSGLRSAITSNNYQLYVTRLTRQTLVAWGN